jgi:hypothetical protein
VHLVGFIVRKYVTMHGHMNVTMHGHMNVKFKNSSSGRLLHAVLWFYDTSSTSCNRPDCLYGCMKEIPLGCSKHVEDTIIKLQYKSHKRAFFCSYYIDFKLLRQQKKIQ